MAKADISIRGRHFSIACAPGQEMRVQRLGEQLDERTSQILAAVGDVGEERLLLITALALLDELDAARQAGPEPSAAGLEAEAARLLGDVARRIEALADRIERGS